MKPRWTFNYEVKREFFSQLHKISANKILSNQTLKNSLLARFLLTSAFFTANLKITILYRMQFGEQIQAERFSFLARIFFQLVAKLPNRMPSLSNFAGKCLIQNVLYLKFIWECVFGKLLVFYKVVYRNFHTVLSLNYVLVFFSYLFYFYLK